MVHFEALHSIFGLLRDTTYLVHLETLHNYLVCLETYIVSVVHQVSSLEEATEAVFFCSFHTLTKPGKDFDLVSIHQRSC